MIMPNMKLEIQFEFARIIGNARLFIDIGFKWVPIDIIAIKPPINCTCGSQCIVISKEGALRKNFLIRKLPLENVLM